MTNKLTPPQVTLVDPQNGRKIYLSDPLSNCDGGEVCEGVVDLLREPLRDNTSEHYDLQWGENIGFQNFSRLNPQAMAATPGRQLGWRDFFDKVRLRGCQGPTLVYDAGCGFGGVMDALFSNPVPPGLMYIGADIHKNLGSLQLPDSAQSQVRLLKWDISNVPPIEQKFDYVICRATIHHTPDPRATFQSLVKCLAVGGEIAISAYARKARVREVVDDGLREQIKRLAPVEAMTIASEFSQLGRSLQNLGEKVTSVRL